MRMRIYALVKSVLFLTLGVYALPGSAQIVPDGTLPVNSTVAPNGNSLVIDGGTTAGSNWFHSFSEFSVPTGTEALFNNAVNIDNILSRITGRNISNIDGLIRANGSANLFLINPNGIVFGPNARLDVGGSFFASTAESVVFGDNVEFSAVQPAANPLLTINVPIGIQMGANPDPITVRGNGHNLTLEGVNNFDPIQPDRNVGLQVKDGNTLALVGGDILLEGGNLTADRGRIELGSVAGAGTVSLMPAPEGFSLDYGEIESFGNLGLTQESSIDASGPGSGNIHLVGGNISALDSSAILNNTLGASNGGQIEILAADTFAMDGGNFLVGIIGQTIGSGNSGDVNIAAQNVQLTNSATISTTAKASGDAGDINITTENLLIQGSLEPRRSSKIEANRAGNGNGGDINIEAQNIQLADFGIISTQSIGDGGDGGDINLSVAGTLTLEMSSFITGTTGNANGGDINIAAQNVQLSNLGIISADTGLFLPTAQGNGGDITLIVAETLTIDGLGSIINTSTGSNGRGGTTIVTAQNVRLANGGKIIASTSGSGAAGTIDLTVADTLIVDGEDSNPNTTIVLNRFSGIISQAGTSAFGNLVPAATGNGGNVNITAGNIQLSNGGNISGTTNGAGNAGTIDLAATGGIEIDAASVTSSVTSEATGNGGVLRLRAPRIALTHSASLDTSTDGSGNAGSIALIASDILQLSDGSRIASSSNSMATGLGGSADIQGGLLQISDSQIEAASDSLAGAGSVTIDVREVNLVENATISVSGNNMGDAGNLLINANAINLDGQSSLQGTVTTGSQGNLNLNSSLLVLRNNSNITTNAGQQANGGNIAIDTINLAAFEDSDITANAVAGQGGNIQIDVEGLFLSPNSEITASSQFGLDGTIQINNPDTDSGTGLVELNQTPIALNSLIVVGCAAAQGNSFIVTGRGGLPPSPEGQLTGDRSWADLRDLSPYRGVASQNISPESVGYVQGAIVEANTWQVNEFGEIELVAVVEADYIQGQSLPPSCDGKLLGYR